MSLINCIPLLFFAVLIFIVWSLFWLEYRDDKCAGLTGRHKWSKYQEKVDSDSDVYRLRVCKKCNRREREYIIHVAGGMDDRDYTDNDDPANWWKRRSN